MKTEKIYCHSNDFEKHLKETINWKTEHKKTQDFLRAYQNGSITGIISSNGNLIKLFYDLKIVCENLKDSTEKGMTDFKERLLTDKLLSYDKNKKQYSGKPYQLKRKNSLLRTAREYLKFLHPKKTAIIDRVLNVKIKIKNSDNETLTEKEYKALLEHAGSIETKAKIELLYWLGVRAEEMHNIRLSDVTLPTEKKQFVKVRVRNEFSKTAGRTIEMFGKKSLTIIKEQLAKRMSEKAEPEDTFFKTTYDTTQKQMNSVGKKAIGKPVNAHLFRHTAATRSASKMNRQQMCVWFGWRFSSPMPDRYINRDRVDMQDVVASFEKANVEELEDKVNFLQDAFCKMYEEITGKKTSGFEGDMLKVLK